MPYAPASSSATRSPGSTGASLRSRAKKSPDSHTGPTTSTNAPFPPSAAREQSRGAPGRARADQIVHGRVGNHESLFAIALHIKHPRQQRAGLRHQKPPRLNQQIARRNRPARDSAPPHIRPLWPPRQSRRRDSRCPGRRRHRSSSARCPRSSAAHQLAHPLHRRAKRVRRANLRANVNADAVRLEPAIPRQRFL